MYWQLLPDQKTQNNLLAEPDLKPWGKAQTNRKCSYIISYEGDLRELRCVLKELHKVNLLFVSINNTYIRFTVIKCRLVHLKYC